ncbi:LytTR family DNA-binding domain-containing protein [Flavobacterium sp.]|uniref:LytTR family DNA-binding domain-containing protein n=1 Tax=Flavobacterium sp. TaxID=239 RepID=UPI002B9C9311|nr:LytTR family DNA-binding domain-containing protein [Flavobacterium sp.]HSD06345.1 LytTR family DNA-binding domain-containing protein [Flavobacterium sp.]
MLQPFDVNPQEQKMPFFWISVLHSSTPIAILLCIALICKLFPITTEDWKIKNECILVFFLILFTGIAQFFIRDIIYDNPNNWSWRYLTEEVCNTFIAGLFLAPIIISINLNRQQLKNNQKADHISSTINEIKKDQTNTLITIETEVKSEKFVFESHHFIYAKAEGNYCEIFLKKDDTITKLIKRIPIKNLEMQLSILPFVIKTHRSILLNINYIKKVTGNAQGYKVQLKDCQDTVPVSRNFIQSFGQATTQQ